MGQGELTCVLYAVWVCPRYPGIDREVMPVDIEVDFRFAGIIAGGFESTLPGKMVWFFRKSVPDPGNVKKALDGRIARFYA